MKTDRSLTFVVLTYNHSGFVLEHLESIGYLIQKFYQIGKHDLVISDDASSDTTVSEISQWLSENKNLFRSVQTYFSIENQGTCKSFLRATEKIKTEYVKITGGDDLFSDEDIFSVVCNCGDAQIIGSQPLVLIDGKFQQFHKFNFIYALANSVYLGKPFREQLIGYGFIFTPGLVYLSSLIKDKRIRNFISQFSLVEDFPSWIAISEFYPDVNYYISEAVLVYYRRSSGSAYLIAGGRVFSDNLACRKYLLCLESKLFNRFLIKNRIWLMNLPEVRIKKILDIGLWVFFMKLIFSIPSLIYYLKLLFIDLKNHVQHYNYIRSRLIK